MKYTVVLSEDLKYVTAVMSEDGAMADVEDDVFWSVLRRLKDAIRNTRR